MKCWKEILLFLILSSIPFYWLRENPIGWGDTGLDFFFYNSDYQLKIFKYVWVSQTLTGNPGGENVAKLPILAIFMILKSLGFDYNIQQSFIFSLILFSSMLFMYLFALELFENEPDKRLIGTISAIFYAFNPKCMINYWYKGNLSLYLLPFLPLSSFLLLLSIKKRNFIHIFLMSLSFSIFSITFLNPAFVLPVLLFLLLIFIHQIMLNWRDKEKTKKIITCIIGTLLLSFLVNSWWILPFSSTAAVYYARAIEVLDPIETLISWSQSTSFAMLFRWIPIKLNAGFWAYKNPTWRWTYNNPLFVILGYTLSVIILFPCLIKRNSKNTLLFFTMILILGLFLSAGLNPPFGFIYEWMFRNIPFIYVFRNPVEKFASLLIISCSILFGFSLSTLYNLAKPKIGAKKSQLIIFTLLLLYCGVYVFPMWTGDVVSNPITIRGDEISSFVRVPNYYSQAALFFQSDQTEYRILSLPLRPLSYVKFNWEYGYDGPDLTFLLYKHSSISSLNYFDQSIEVSIYKLPFLYSIRYIIVQADVDPIHGNYGGITLKTKDEIISFLNSVNAEYVKSFGSLDIYRLPDQCFLPRIYPANVYVLVNDSMKSIAGIFTISDFVVNRNIVFLFHNISREDWYLFLKNIGAIYLKSRTIGVETSDGSSNPFQWSLVAENSIQARYYFGWKTVVRTDGREPEDTLSFPSLESCPYRFPPFSPVGWNAFNSTLVFIKTGSEPMIINELIEDERPIKDIVGVWWETGWMGMNTNPIEFPVVIPANQKAIIQIGHIVEGSIKVNLIDIINLTRIEKNAPRALPVITFKRVNPTKYIVQVENASAPFFLVFLESYNPQWKVYIEDGLSTFDEIIAEYAGTNVKEARHDWFKFTPEDILYLFKKPSLNETLHFMANGYANAWYIDPMEIDKDEDGKFTITLFYLPQSLLYLGLIVSCAAFIFCIILLISKLSKDFKNLKKCFVPSDWHVCKTEIEKLNLSKTSSILDIGSGDGRKALFVFSKTRGNLILSDIKRVKPPLETDFVRLDGRMLPFRENSFDFVTCFHVLEHLREGKKLLDEIWRVLKDGGVLLLVTPNAVRFESLFSPLLRKLKKVPYKYPLNPDHVVEYSPYELESLIKSSNFKIYTFKPIFMKFSRILRIPKYANQILVIAKK